MRIIHGTCPHCGETTQCGILDNKLAATCQSCAAPLFDSIRAKLKLVNALFVVPLLPPMIGVALRPSLGTWGCFALIVSGGILLFGVLFLERYFCQRALSPKNSP